MTEPICSKDKSSCSRRLTAMIFPGIGDSTLPAVGVEASAPFCSQQIVFVQLDEIRVCLPFEECRVGENSFVKIDRRFDAVNDINFAGTRRAVQVTQRKRLFGTVLTLAGHRDGATTTFGMTDIGIFYSYFPLRWCKIPLTLKTPQGGSQVPLRNLPGRQSTGFCICIFFSSVDIHLARTTALPHRLIPRLEDW